MHRRHRLAAAATVVALAGSTAVLSAVPAAAASSYAELSITPSPFHAGYYIVIVRGHVHDAGPTTTVGMRLIGDDPVFNDDLGVSLSTTAVGTNFAMEALVWHGTLNEDPEGGDEIFAKVSASNGWSRSTANVNGRY
ncbi:MAG: hypothetical protein IR158_10555 [Cellulomonas sp.]|uniref:hypothetical protein n=1 Tax=Cellulomonas sp. TaxID=40001 RepID=UPI0019ECAD41|nr:hypothetical protein [Cellulomonas sp.]MBF0688185.1 hypothetical protein [Cellulomonas sp.]